jgi:membrane-anchored glycerophosphoryl diester phosphodiesterase (GDPDase)
MQAILDLGHGVQPVIADVVRRGVKVLAVVAAADIVAGLTEFAGLLFFVIPGILAAVRLAVVAPAAASEQITWPEAIRRSLILTRGNFRRVLGLLVIQAVLLYLVATIIGASSIAVAIVGAALAVVAQSFCTLLINLLYFDLHARQAAPVASQ